jgi:hypothetical protein
MISTPLLANIGLPMILLHWPLMLAALLPIILVEAQVIRHRLPMPYRQAVIGVGRANVFSTIAGVPLAWAVMFLLQMGVMIPLTSVADKWHWAQDGPVWQVLELLVGAAWLGPGVEKTYWMVPIASAILLLPCFYLSVMIERKSCLNAWPDHDPEAVRRGVFRANVASYLLLFLMACGWLAWELMVHGTHREYFHGTLQP